MTPKTAQPMTPPKVDPRDDLKTSVAVTAVVVDQQGDGFRIKGGDCPRLRSASRT
jgi:hypothetical protein